MATAFPISIVVPVYNRAGIVGRTLDSIAAQTFRPLHVVIVDNNSTDNTLSVITDWKAKLNDEQLAVDILQEPIAGACNARNAGLRAADSEYVMFFDSDDVMAPCHVERAMRIFEANPDADIVGWDVDSITLQGKHRRLIFGRNDYLFNHIFHASLSTQRFACRTDLIDKAGGWDPTIFGWDDYELGVRILLQNPKIIYAGTETTVIVHCQEESISGTEFASEPGKWEHSLDLCSRHLKDNRQALIWIDTRRIILAGHYRKEGNTKEGQRLKNEVLQRTGSLRKRLFYKFIYHLISLGGRGAARFVKLFL